MFQVALDFWTSLYVHILTHITNPNPLTHITNPNPA